ncbi:MAG: WD40/YVTN/BNR-like repeat-containing protein [Vicinamibacterales bacterium]
MSGAQPFRNRLRWVACAVLLSGAAASALAQAQPAAPAIDPALYKALEWRNIGPFRGGRATTVAGVPGDPLVYYMGATGGGVWKTEDAGLTWRNVSDGFMKTGSVGAIAVAESDPNVVYVGMGEAPVRGVATSHGDGVYRSTDAGRTWVHLGLEQTRHISMIVVHPSNPDVVYVAAQGSPWGPNPERGIYRSTDGGDSWTLVHTVNDTTGASDLAMDMTNPRILYAAYWDHQRLPWRVRSGGPGSGLYRSTDAGSTWTRLTAGLPRLMGKVAVSVSRARPERVFTLIEAEDGGLFRSDDGGATWQLVNEERVLRTRAWYYINVFADPGDADTVYVLNAPMLKSIDAGRTFVNVPTPHGDNHGLWINPRNSRWMINANDGGANVSLDGGRAWSTQANQPTAQFYRVNTDARAPYWVYGGQQDNSSVAIASRSSGVGIGSTDWHPVGGCESAYAAFNPAAPDYVYAGCYQGIITEWSRATGATRNVMAYAALGLGEPSNEQKYRFNWNAPILVSRHDPSVIYHAGNHLFRSEDRGNSWTPISPDLTRNDPATQGPGGAPITNEGAGGEVYNTIFYVAESPADARTIWVGTDDGLVHVTRDGGKQWSNVTPKDMGEFQVNAIEISPHDPATVYLAVTGYKRNDFTPHVFTTRDGGRSWERLVAGLPDGSFVRVVREDPIRRGLLYAGTETGAHVSFNGGRTWQSLQLNLPVVPVTDLRVHDRDLVASTQGRAFWILDDVTPLRSVEAGVASRALHLYAPAPAVRWPVPQGRTQDPAVGQNAPAGVVIYYSLAASPGGNETLVMEVLDGAGKVVRRLTSAAPPRAGASGAPGVRLPALAGLNRFVWDMRTAPIDTVPGQYINGNLQGYRIGPGTYRVRLTLGTHTAEQSLRVLPDPRTTLTEATFVEQQTLLAAIHARVGEIHRRVVTLRDLRDQATAIVERHARHPQAAAIREVAENLTAALTAWEDEAIQSRQKTFQDVINFRNQLNAHYLYVAEQLDGTDPTVTDGIRARLTDLDAEWATRDGEWREILAKTLPAFSTALTRAGVGTISVKP